jgi:hypothetical protein
MLGSAKCIAYYIIIFKNMFLSPYINQQSINQSINDIPIFSFPMIPLKWDLEMKQQFI